MERGKVGARIGVKARPRQDGRAIRREEGLKARKEEKEKMLMARRRIPLLEMQGEEKAAKTDSKGSCHINACPHSLLLSLSPYPSGSSSQEDR